MLNCVHRCSCNNWKPILTKIPKDEYVPVISTGTIYKMEITFKGVSIYSIQ